MKLLMRVINIFDRVSNLLAFLGASLLLFMTLIVTAEVFTRYALGDSIGWVWEVVSFSLLYLTFLGAAWVLKWERHVKIEVILNYLKPKTQSLVNIITSIVGAVVCLLLTRYAVWVAVNYFQTGVFFETPLETPKFVVFVIIPVGLFSLFIQFLRRAYSFLMSYRALSDKEPGSP